MSVKYNIIATGSQGNAVVLNDAVLIDCGVPFKALQPYYSKLKLVLLTHCHGDHFNRTTIKRLAKERPMLRWGAGRWLIDRLVDCGVTKSNIDVFEFGQGANYGSFNVEPVQLHHNVPNCGYKLHFPTGKIFYATDTNNLNGVIAKDFDLYLVEANFEDEEIRARIAEKRETGAYSYEIQVLENHLSKAKADDFIYKNIGQNGEYCYLHFHVEKGAVTDEGNSSQL